MKRILIALLAGLSAFSPLRAQKVRFEVCDGLEDAGVREKLERNVSALLSEINRAQKEGTPLGFSGIGISPQGRKDLDRLWENVPFYCEDDWVVETVLHTPDNGLQIRNIPLMLSPEDNSLSDGNYQEGVIDFDSRGTIRSFYFALPVQLYRQIIADSLEIEDVHRRQRILDYVEHFRTAYNQKDMRFLQQVFSNDAIIITGKVIRLKPTELNPYPTDRIFYKSQDKVTYLRNLKRVFAANRYIKVNFTEIKLRRHATHKDFYGVLLKQGYVSSSYSDEGYLFMLWDFSDETSPQIHVRTWQPYYIDKAKKKIIAEEDIIDIADMEGL